MNVCGVLLSLNCMQWGGKGDVSSALEWTLFFKSENTEESDQSATNETTYFSLVYGVLTIPFCFMIRIKALV